MQFYGTSRDYLLLDCSQRSHTTSVAFRRYLCRLPLMFAAGQTAVYFSV